MNTARDQENMDGRENGYQFKPAFMIFQCTWMCVHYFLYSATIGLLTCQGINLAILICYLLESLHVQWNLYSSFSSGVWKRNNGSGSHSWNRIRSGTIEIERRIRENELSGNDR
jgi:hypothetical protein